MMTWRCELASKRELVSSIKWLGMMHGTASISTVDGTWKTDHSHKDWAWRVVVSDAEGVDNPMTVYGQKPRFDSIVEFLDWYSS